MTNASEGLVPLSELFEVDRGNKLDLNKMPEISEEGERIAFVGRSGSNNGVAAWVGRIGTLEPYPAGRISVAMGGAPLSTFIQVTPFYTAQNVAVLAAKQDYSFEELLYYVSAIKANQFRYSAYGREANRTLAHLLLPAEIPSWVADLSFPDLRSSHEQVWPLLRTALEGPPPSE